MLRVKSSGGFPRKNNIAYMIPAEKLVHEAIIAIESLGADVKLTNAQIKLQEAAALLSEYVDENLVQQVD